MTCTSCYIVDYVVQVVPVTNNFECESVVVWL